ncbi:Oidioi.mRNA.OKI2018_I69.chr2.g8226.t1.cds [Oikopleura dioica]|uniref:Oidioi.mRNA.OKI2018_I69.chr2.g8226.t1.cds n=1 Tax=Oikopleura dioica TaxID=34765 RepID=A0ABN7T8L3_OIKDI|nr:Oidioi.mRNA.OKI2018_I69.chr2.g8226.t1.cds [Oikopleura dioica]
MSYANEIVYAHGEGPTPPARMASNPKVPPAKKVSRAKLWDESVEDNFRFQAAQYRDEIEYKAVHPNGEVCRWPSGMIKKLLRKDGTWNYFNKERECYKNLHLVKMYEY